MTGTATPLQRQLADRIAALINEQGLAVGARVNQSDLAKSLGVSRSPVRAAMEILARDGILQHQPNRGMTVARRPSVSAPVDEAAEDDEAEIDKALIAISGLRRRGELAKTFSEAS